MCGISGFISFNNSYTETDLQKMNNLLAHRGPNAEGYFFDGICGLGHRRLSIIDLSESANQPMHSSNDRYVIAFNGEIYNFQEIGAKLSGSAEYPTVKFKTSSDTEVILEAFSFWGTEFVHHLNGMFAIAIYDKLEKELHLFRDRVGIKPLFYYWNQEKLAFASELKSLESLPNNRLTVNKAAIAEFLHLGFIPAPSTIYNSIYKLKPGTYLKVNKRGIEEMKYWDLTEKITPQIISSKDEALVKLSDLLMSSVQYQLRSDVPYGVFLSGGIDSSLVTAQAANLSSVQISTFSIGFEENRFNESKYAKAVSQHFGTDHHEFIVSYKDAIELVEPGFSSYDEPNADSSVIPTMLVSKLARKHVTMTLSGEGGDELFLGYGTYQWARRLQSPLIRMIAKPASVLLNQMPSRYQRISKMINTGASSDLLSHIFSQEQYYFTGQEIDQLIQEQYSKTSPENKSKSQSSGSKHIFEKSNKRQLNAMERQAIFDMQYYLPDDLLTKVDRASMHYSLETRVPFLDHRVLEFALNLSPDLKYKDGISKYILKEILYQYAPKSLFDRPKQGFSIPLSKWLKNELRYLIDDYLNINHVEKTGFVKSAVVEKLKQDFFSGQDYLFVRIWLLISLHRWAKDHSTAF